MINIVNRRRMYGADLVRRKERRVARALQKAHQEEITVELRPSCVEGKERQSASASATPAADHSKHQSEVSAEQETTDRTSPRCPRSLLQDPATGQETLHTVHRLAITQPHSITPLTTPIPPTPPRHPQNPTRLSRRGGDAEECGGRCECEC